MASMAMENTVMVMDTGYGYGYEPKDKKNSSDSAATDKNSTGK